MSLLFTLNYDSYLWLTPIIMTQTYRELMFAFHKDGNGAPDFNNSCLCPRPATTEARNVKGPERPLKA